MAIPTNLLFDSYDLQTTNIKTRSIHHKHYPNRVIDIESNLRVADFVFVSSYWDKKIITVKGSIVTDSANTLRTVIDAMKNKLQGTEKNLDVDYGDGVMRYTATVQSLEIPDDFYYISLVPFTIEFLCQPYGKSTTSTNSSKDDITTSPVSHSLTVTGSSDPLPTITLTVDNETTMTAIQFENNTTNDTITITRAFADAEVLVIDCENQTVKVDDVNVDFDGVFPRFSNGTNNCIITITDGGAFNVDLDIDYYPHYL